MTLKSWFDIYTVFLSFISKYRNIEVLRNFISCELIVCLIPTLSRTTTVICLAVLCLPYHLGLLYEPTDLSFQIPWLLATGWHLFIERICCENHCTYLFQHVCNYIIAQWKDNSMFWIIRFLFQSGFITSVWAFKLFYTCINVYTDSVIQSF